MEKYLAFFFFCFKILKFYFSDSYFASFGIINEWSSEELIFKKIETKNSQVFFHCNSSKIISFDFCVHNIIMASYEKQLLIILDNNVKPMNQM